MTTTVPRLDTVNAATLCRRADITYRQLDHWCRLGVIRPVGGMGTPGSGFARRFDMREVHVAAAVAELRDLGAPLDLAADVAEQLRVLDEWPGYVCVTRAGLVVTTVPAEGCWLLRLADLAA